MPETLPAALPDAEWLEADGLGGFASGNVGGPRSRRYHALLLAATTPPTGPVEIDSNVVERTIRPIALNRKNALFAGSDQGGVHWGVIASLIETCKLNAVDPQAYLEDVLSRLVNRHPASHIDQLMPWAYVTAHQVA